MLTFLHERHTLHVQYDDMNASTAFLKASVAAQDVSEGLMQNHGAVRNFMEELLSGVCPLTSSLWGLQVEILHVVKLSENLL